jgi:hypothetical protein
VYWPEKVFVHYWSGNDVVSIVEGAICIAKHSKISHVRQPNYRRDIATRFLLLKIEKKWRPFHLKYIVINRMKNIQRSS